MIGFSYASSSTYLCEYIDGYIIEPKNIVDYPIGIPKDKFLVRKYDDYVIIKDGTRKTKLTFYRKDRTSNKDIISRNYSGNHYMGDDSTLDFSIFINLQTSLIQARLIDLAGTHQISFGFYKCSNVDF